MCGIWALFGDENVNFRECECYFRKIQHRGPDAIRFQHESELKNAYLGFHKLLIINTPYGTQPLRLYQHPSISLLCNGEIYNHRNLAEEFGFEYETGTDVECIVHLFQKFGIEKCAQQLDGVYAFCIVDFNAKYVYLGRDPFGVRPLFRMVTENGILGISSEAKGLIDLAKNLKNTKWHIEQFPPGCYAKYQIGSNYKCHMVEEKRFYEIGIRPFFKSWYIYEDLTENISDNIRNLLAAAVEKRLMSDRRIGCMLSGGLDSSLVTSLLVKLSKEKNIPYRIQSFSLGINAKSPDLLAAREMAEHVGTEHHEILFTEDDIFEVLDDVIYFLETYDILTVRASICMYLVSRYIKRNTDTTVIFSGEGADELAQGYIYFRDAPTAEDGNKESLKLLSEIHFFDGLRPDRTTGAHGLELRVPFLDQQFTNYYLSLPPELRVPKDGRVEKYLIRSSFNETGLLPQNILWRQKEEFCDGVTPVSRSLFTIIQEWVENKISNVDLKNAPKKYPYLTPQTKEAYYYRKVFEKYYPGLEETLVPHYLFPNWSNNKDPSARLLEHYAA